MDRHFRQKVQSGILKTNSSLFGTSMVSANVRINQENQEMTDRIQSWYAYLFQHLIEINRENG